MNTVAPAITGADIAAIAAEALAALDSGRPIASFSARHPGFDLADAYRVQSAMRRMREQRGERAVGRKIGFINRTIWPEYNVYAPNWGTMYDRTVRNLADLGGAFALGSLAEPRIEPEIVFGLSRAPAPDMDDAALLAAVEWIALGYELVQSPFPSWKFSPADTTAANALHGALLIGPRFAVAAKAAEWLRALPAFTVELKCNGSVMDRGHARNVLDGPLNALRHLVGLLARDPDNPPIAAGEIVTTGTLTRALPVKPGETWTTELSGITLPSISIRFS
jgi:2-oxo-3-hexenedioate decarboxylase